MKSDHYTPIITKARQGLPVSTANRPRPRLNWPALGLLVALVLFWAGVAFLVSLIR